jgi:hypothetical protein
MGVGMVDVHRETTLMGKCVLERGSAGMEAKKWNVRRCYGDENEKYTPMWFIIIGAAPLTTNTERNRRTVRYTPSTMSLIPR